jgi:hypothetical protein
VIEDPEVTQDSEVALAAGTDALERVLGETRRVLEAVGARGAAGAGVPASARRPIRGTGEAADGRIRATVVSPTRVESIHLDDTVRELDPDALATAVRSAVNRAFDDLTARAAVPSVRPEVLAERLRTVQEESLRSMAAVCAALTEALSSVQAAVRR